MYLKDDTQIAERFHFRNQDICSRIQQWVELHPNKVFLYWHPFEGKPQTWTYQEFWNDVRALGAGLQQKEIKSGDRVLIHSENCPEMLISWYACAFIGAIAVTINTGAVPVEMAHYIKTTEPVAAITQPRYAPLLRGFSDSFQWVAITDQNSDGTTDDNALRDSNFEKLSGVYRDPEIATPANCTALTPAGILFTSGTTGLSKAVVHTHGNWMWAAITGPLNIDFSADDVMLTYLPLFHVNAQMWATATAIGRGGSIVLLPKVTVSRFWSIVKRYGVSHLTMLPLVYLGVAKDIPSSHSLKVVATAQPPAPEENWNCRFQSLYGSSETVIQAIISSPHVPWTSYELGQVVPGYQIQLINPDTGEPCTDGETGELWVKGTRGIQLFLEYYNDPEATSSAFTANWFRTGDLVRLGDDEKMYFVQRLKDVIKVGGENVDVSEVESVIAKVPGVKGAAVVAKQDDALQEIPVAFVIAAEGADFAKLEEAILQRCRDSLSPFKIPRHVCGIDEFPRALLDKIAKNKLRDMADKL